MNILNNSKFSATSRIVIFVAVIIGLFGISMFMQYLIPEKKSVPFTIDANKISGAIQKEFGDRANLKKVTLMSNPSGSWRVWPKFDVWLEVSDNEIDIEGAAKIGILDTENEGEIYVIFNFLSAQNIETNKEQLYKIFDLDVVHKIEERL